MLEFSDGENCMPGDHDEADDRYDLLADDGETEDSDQEESSSNTDGVDLSQMEKLIQGMLSRYDELSGTFPSKNRLALNNILAKQITVLQSEICGTPQPYMRWALVKLLNRLDAKKLAAILLFKNSVVDLIMAPGFTLNDRLQLPSPTVEEQKEYIVYINLLTDTESPDVIFATEYYGGKVPYRVQQDTDA